MIRARHATRADVDDLGGALAAAFRADPVWRWIVPDDARWGARAAAAFGAEVAVKLRAGHTYTTDDRAGVALWTPPGLWRDPAAGQLRVAPSMGRLVGARGVRRGLGVLRAVERVHPEPEHWYLAFLGTHPDHQGRGVASALLAPVLQRCDLDGTPAFLESSNPGNVAFYERHGFRVTGRAAAPGAPPLDLMWREPRPVAEAAA